jgi:hypothetical protein
MRFDITAIPLPFFFKAGLFMDSYFLMPRQRVEETRSNPSPPLFFCKLGQFF